MKTIFQALFEFLGSLVIWNGVWIFGKAIEKICPLKQESSTSTGEKAQEQNPRPARLYWGFGLFVVLMLLGVYLLCHWIWR